MTIKTIKQNLEAVRDLFKAADKFREEGTLFLDYTVTIEEGKEKLAKYKEEKADVTIKVLMEELKQPYNSIIDMVYDIERAINWIKSNR